MAPKTKAISRDMMLIRPVQPVAPWLGDKRNLARRLIARINTIPHAGVIPFTNAMISHLGPQFNDKRQKHVAATSTVIHCKINCHATFTRQKSLLSE